MRYQLTWSLASTMWAIVHSILLVWEVLVNPLNTTLRWASTVGTTLCILSYIVARRRYGSMEREWPAAVWTPLIFPLICLFPWIILICTAFLAIYYNHEYYFLQIFWWVIKSDDGFWTALSPILAVDVTSQGSFEGIVSSDFAVWLILFINLVTINFLLSYIASFLEGIKWC